MCPSDKDLRPLDRTNAYFVNAWIADNSLLRNERMVIIQKMYRLFTA